MEQRDDAEVAQLRATLRERDADVERLGAELEETNRGVLALYAELDDRALELKRLTEVKSRFLSDIGHELRTPLASMVNLARILLDRTDGELNAEQDRQVSMIRRAAENAVEMVNDLLDLAKIESGRVTLRPSDFTVGELFSGLRGLVRPLITSEEVALVFEEPDEPLMMHSDEQRLAQVLRNFLSNAIKFTPRGEIRVRSVMEPDGMVRFDVSDTGIGIAPADRERIFQDFEQVDTAQQRGTRGTGLGLPLTRKLANLLGGRVELESEPGRGSTFSVIVPREIPAAQVDDAQIPAGAHG